MTQKEYLEVKVLIRKNTLLFDLFPALCLSYIIIVALLLMGVLTPLLFWLMLVLSFVAMILSTLEFRCFRRLSKELDKGYLSGLSVDDLLKQPAFEKLFPHA